MQSQPHPKKEHWTLAALRQVLDQHNKPFGESQKRNYGDIYIAIFALDTSPLVYLEILRIFNLALCAPNPLKIDSGELQTLDLFYASAVVGLKFYQDSHPFEITNTAFHNELPPFNRYRNNPKKSCAIERAFIFGIDWQLPLQSESAFETIHEKLTQLDAAQLNSFAASHLLTSCTDTGNNETIDTVLYQLKPSYRENFALVRQMIQSIPLLYSFIESPLIIESFEQDIRAYLRTGQSRFGFSTQSIKMMRDAVREYFYHGRHPIRADQIDFLSNYFMFSEATIIKIRTKSAISRIQMIIHQLGIDITAFRNLLKNERDPIRNFMKNSPELNWVETVADKLELLMSHRHLCAQMMNPILRDSDKSIPMLDLYLRLEIEVLLQDINKNHRLRTEIAEMLYRHANTQVETVIPMIKLRIENLKTKSQPAKKSWFPTLSIFQSKVEEALANYDTKRSVKKHSP